MPSLKKKPHEHFFSPWTIIQNYIRDTKTSIQDFFKQYLKTQQKAKLIIFNRYMILILILNIDIKVLILIGLITLTAVKIIKIDLWEKIIKKWNNLIPGTNEKKRIRKKSNSSENGEEQQFFRIGSSQELHSSKRIKKDQIDGVIITNFESEYLQQKIYKFFNTLAQYFVDIINYAKWKFVWTIVALTVLIYIFEPQYKEDTFHIFAKHSEDGEELIIESIKKSSQFTNKFFLATIWISTNALLFYRFGTNQLKNQLLQETFQRTYWRKNKFKKKFTLGEENVKDDHDIRDDKSERSRYSSINARKSKSIMFVKRKNTEDKAQIPITIEMLKQYAIQLAEIKNKLKSELEQKNNILSKNQSKVQLNEQQSFQKSKYSSQLKTSRKQKAYHQQMACSEQKDSNQQKLQSQFTGDLDKFDAISIQLRQQEEEKYEEEIPRQFEDQTKKQLKQGERSLEEKIQVSNHPELVSSVPAKIDRRNIFKIQRKQSEKTNRQTCANAPRMYKKISFLPLNQNTLRRPRKQSQQYLHNQKYDDFKLNLIKVQESQNNKIKKI